MPEIVLATLNARYIHAAFGLRYLLANLGPLRERTMLLEFDLQPRPLEIVEAILKQQPRIVGLGVYVWNAAPTREVVALLKRARPEVTVVLGGPEVSYETDAQEIARLADYVITGEAELAFASLCAEILDGRAPAERIIAAPLPSLDQVALPYDFYTDHDLAHRIIYVEASRGCPFSCEFCLSSLDIAVRQFPLEAFLAAMERLWQRGARHFKFVDRTFNVDVRMARSILEFFLPRCDERTLLHFEVVPDRLPESLKELLLRFPAGTIQFEAGVQTFNPEVAARISRRQDFAKTEANLRWLRDSGRIHLHTDLIVGLPGESLESFAAGFDRLIGLGVQEIQVGILKRLRGTLIARHDAEWQMVYSPFPPYEILRNRDLDFETMQDLRRFARFWDLFGNSGDFLLTTPRLWTRPAGSPFEAFLQFSRWLFGQLNRQHSVALDHLAGHLFRYLTEVGGLPATEVAESLAQDYARTGRGELPPAVRPHLPPGHELGTVRNRAVAGKRQQKHRT